MALSPYEKRAKSLLEAWMEVPIGGELTHKQLLAVNRLSVLTQNHIEAMEKDER